jgi:DNA ligase-1
MNVVETLTLLRETPGTLDKKNIIKENNSDLLELIFKDTYDTSVKYNVKKYEVWDKVLYSRELFGPDLQYYHIDNNYCVFHGALEELASGRLTGNAAVKRIGEVIGYYVPEERWILDGILQRNLKVGVSLDNYNDAVGKMAVQKYEVALADKFFDLKPDKQNEIVTSGKYLISRKLDGVRCTIHYNPQLNTLDFISRQGKKFWTLDNLIEPIIDVLQFVNEPVVLDGEVCIVDENGNENFLGLMSEVTRKNHTIAHPKFMWFDILTLDEFEGRKQSPDFGSRYNVMLDYYYHSSRPAEVQVLQQYRCESWYDFEDWTSLVKKNGWEGFMLRKDVPYKSGRSKDLLKVKKMQDAEYVVEDVVMGKVSYNEGGVKEYDAASSLVINHKGNKVYVGSGLSKEQRLRWYEHPEEIIGKTITVQYFEETQDKKTGEYSLRFPILKVVYENGRDV